MFWWIILLDLLASYKIVFD